MQTHYLALQTSNDEPGYDQPTIVREDEEDALTFCMSTEQRGLPLLLAQFTLHMAAGSFIDNSNISKPFETTTISNVIIQLIS